MAAGEIDMMVCPNCGALVTQTEIDHKSCLTCNNAIYFKPLPPMPSDDLNPMWGEDNDPTPTQRLLQRHRDITGAAHAIMKIKNHDYAGASEDTPFRNFEMAKNLGVCSVEAGIILRMGDKLQRLATFATDGKLEVPGEGTFDAVLDIINYAIILQTYIEEK